MKRIAGKRGEQVFDPQQVLYLTGNINYSYLHLASGDVVLSCRTLKWFSEQWSGFLRVHKNALVNLAYIAFSKVTENGYDNNYIIMADQTQLDIARRRVLDVYEVLHQRDATPQSQTDQ